MIAFSRQQDPALLEKYCDFIDRLDFRDPAYLLPIAHVLVSSYEAVQTRTMAAWRAMNFAQFQLLHPLVKIVIQLYDNGQSVGDFRYTQQSVRANVLVPIVKFVLSGRQSSLPPHVVDGVQYHTLAEVAFLALRALVIKGDQRTGERSE